MQDYNTDLTDTCDSNNENALRAMKALGIVIRPAVSGDMRLLEWHGQFWHFRTLFRQAYEDHLLGKRMILVADKDGYPIGRLIVFFGPGHPMFADGKTRAYLYSLHVHQAYQGQRIGTNLLLTAENDLRQRGFRWATISVAQENTSAQRLYERLGFHRFREDTSRWSYADPNGQKHTVQEHCWVLQKSL